MPRPTEAETSGAETKRLKKEISSWLEDFKRDNGRDPTQDDKRPIADKIKALKKVPMQLC